MTHLITLKGEAFEARLETYQGRDWTVVPVVAMVEGVVFPMAAKAPELVPYDVYAKAPQGWNGRPVFVGHPLKGGKPVSGNTPDVLEELGAGQVFNAGLKKNKLVMEAWIDNARAGDVPDLEDLLQRIADKEVVEVSIGAFVTVKESKGTYGDKDYESEWLDIVPDHLALLQKGDEGACSVDAGCGIRAAHADRDQKTHAGGGGGAVTDQTSGKGSSQEMPRLLDAPNGTVVAKSKYGQVETVTSDTQPTRYKGRRKSGEVVGTFNTTYSAADALRAPVNSNDYPSGYRREDVVWKWDISGLAAKGDDMPEPEKGRGRLARMFEMLRTLVNPGELTDNDVRRKLWDAVRAVESRDFYVEAVADGWFVYCVYGPDYAMAGYYKRTFSLSDSGDVTLGDPQEVEPRTVYDEVAALAAAEAKNAGQGASCSCKKDVVAPTTAKEEKKMTKQEAIEKLGIPEAEASALFAPAPAAPAAEVQVQAAKPLVTEEDVINAAPEALRDTVKAGFAAAKQRKDTAIKALRDSGRCDLTDAQLGSKTQDELDALVKLLGNAQPKPAVDFSAQGAPRPTGEEPKEAPAPRDLAAEFKGRK